MLGRTPKPSKEQKLAEENWRLQSENADMRNHIAFYQQAIRSIVLRLKVLDIEQMEKEMGEDGTVPMRMALRELRNLIRAYDHKIDDPDSLTDSLTESPTMSYTPTPTTSYSKKRRHK